ncbi:MAG: citramalate synthase [Eubacteriales bacterium]|nr:citramalate synthase [Eubacteriales bacterium]
MIKIEFLDSTMRDGAQGSGISLSNADRMKLCRLLDEMGLDFIEAGNPVSNPKEAEFFAQRPGESLRRARLTAFGSTCRKGVPAGEDAGLAALLAADTPAVVLFGKAWLSQVKDVLQTTPEENLRMVRESAALCAAAGKLVIFDAEHFYDGFSQEKTYALEVLAAAREGGAQRLVLCDTRGGTLPHQVGETTAAAVQAGFAGLGVHCHDDTGCAVANTLEAVRAGARHVQGTLLGVGERCGNANLLAVIADLQLKMGYSCVSPETLARLTHYAASAAEICNTSVWGGMPYVGRGAFAHKAGMHIDGVAKSPAAFEHVPPESVGNRRDFLLSEAAGRTALAQRLKAWYPDIRRDSPENIRLVETLKQREQEGYQFEGAEATFALLVKKCFGEYEPFFKLDYYKVISEPPQPSTDISATAAVKVDVNGAKQVTAYEGKGPVNALDGALRKALEVFYPTLRSVHLIDYKVRVLESGPATASRVRVVIESTDGQSVWATAGVSTDIIDASLMALTDAVEYKLICAKEER